MFIKNKNAFQVGCVPSAALAISGGWLPGGLPRGGGLPGGCLPQGGVCHTPPPCEQNHRRLWKHNLAATTLRTVKCVALLNFTFQSNKRGCRDDRDCCWHHSVIEDRKGNRQFFANKETRLPFPCDELKQYNLAKTGVMAEQTFHSKQFLPGQILISM